MKPFVVVCILLQIVGFPVLLVWVLKTDSPIALVLLIVVSTLGSLGIGAACMHFTWNSTMRTWPPRDPAPDAIRRNFQSFSLGLINLGWSVHVAADKEFLHLRPATLVRWLGAASASIPWQAMQPLGGRRGTAVRLGHHTMIAPRWCVELVSPETG